MDLSMDIHIHGKPDINIYFLPNLRQQRTVGQRWMLYNVQVKRLKVKVTMGWNMVETTLYGRKHVVQSYNTMEGMHEIIAKSRVRHNSISVPLKNGCNLKSWLLYYLINILK